MITPAQIRQASNSFPSVVNETYEAAATRIEVLEADLAALAQEKEDAEERAMIYQEQEYQTRTLLERIVQLIPATSEEWHQAQRILNETA